MQKYLRCYAQVDLDAIEHNIDEVRKKVGEDVAILAVIKADGYGHGAIPIAHRLKDKVQYFAVATLEEAVELRAHEVSLPILILGYTSPSQFEELLQYEDIIPTIYSLDMANAMENVAATCNKTAKVHIAIDTGMSRIGFLMNDDSVRDVVKIQELEHVQLEGMFSHFACADMKDKEFSHRQMERYDWFVQELEAKGVFIPVKHLCNSAGIIEFDHHHFNMVRAGIIIYGLHPSDEVAMDSMDFWPALSWKTHVINVKTVDAGCGVSYGATYVTDKPTRIATLSVGYADGYPRSLSNKGKVLIHGQYAPIIGRVCMDQMMVDVTDIEDVSMEDVAVLVGTDGDRTLSVEDVAGVSGRFNYEFVCDIGQRVPRIY